MNCPNGDWMSKAAAKNVVRFVLEGLWNSPETGDPSGKEYCCDKILSSIFHIVFA